jgi:hypothetical protein
MKEEIPFLESRVGGGTVRVKKDPDPFFAQVARRGVTRDTFEDGFNR